MFKLSRQNNLFIFIISYDYYELPNGTIKANGKIYQIVKPNIFGDVQILYRDKASMDTTLNGFRLLTSTCWNEKYQALTIDLTKDKFTGRYPLGLKSLFIPDSSPSYLIGAFFTLSGQFFAEQTSIYPNVFEEDFIIIGKLAAQKKPTSYQKLKNKQNFKTNS